MKIPVFLITVATILFNCITIAIVLDTDNGSKFSCFYPVSLSDIPESIRDAAALTAHGAQELYNGNKSGGTVGKWPFPPYYCKC